MHVHPGIEKEVNHLLFSWRRSHLSCQSPPPLGIPPVKVSFLFISILSSWDLVGTMSWLDLYSFMKESAKSFRFFNFECSKEVYHRNAGPVKLFWKLNTNSWSFLMWAAILLQNIIKWFMGSRVPSYFATSGIFHFSGITTSGISHMAAAPGVRTFADSRALSLASNSEYLLVASSPSWGSDPYCFSSSYTLCVGVG